MFVSDLPNSLKESTFDQRIRQRQENSNSIYKLGKELVGGKEQYYDWKSRREYKNSDKLLQQLMPVPVKPSVTVGQGIYFALQN